MEEGPVYPRRASGCERLKAISGAGRRRLGRAGRLRVGRCRRRVDPRQRSGVRALVRLTAKGNRGCNGRGGPEFVSSRRPVPSVLATAETPSSVPPDSLIRFQPEALRFVRAFPIVDLTLDNLAEPSQRIDEDAPACARASRGSGLRRGPMRRARPGLLIDGHGRAGSCRIQEGDLTCPSDRS
jgi:hypothetical protein